MNHEEEVNYILDAFSKIDMTITEQQAEQFALYYEMLVKKNEVMNLTAITEFEEVVRKHFIDSVYQVALPDENGRLMDVGTGAGFPGIPLKIMYPSLQVTLLDSLNKRVDFLNDVIQALGLKKITAVHSRAEDGARNPSFRAGFDMVVSRAVANLSTLCEYCLPFVKVGGTFISYKADASAELLQAEYAIKVLGGDTKKIQKNEFVLPGSDEHRTLLYILKTSATPKTYPRRSGTPSKDPLHK